MPTRVQSRPIKALTLSRPLASSVSPSLFSEPDRAQRRDGPRALDRGASACLALRYPSPTDTLAGGFFIVTLFDLGRSRYDGPGTSHRQRLTPKIPHLYRAKRLRSSCRMAVGRDASFAARVKASSAVGTEARTAARATTSSTVGAEALTAARATASSAVGAAAHATACSAVGAAALTTARTTCYARSTSESRMPRCIRRDGAGRDTVQRKSHRQGGTTPEENTENLTVAVVGMDICLSPRQGHT